MFLSKQVCLPWKLDVRWSKNAFLTSRDIFKVDEPNWSSARVPGHTTTQTKVDNTKFFFGCMLLDGSNFSWSLMSFRWLVGWMVGGSVSKFLHCCENPLVGRTRKWSILRNMFQMSHVCKPASHILMPSDPYETFIWSALNYMKTETNDRTIPLLI